MNISYTLGTKRTTKVTVAQKMTIHEVKMYNADVSLVIRKLTETPTMHSTTVLYTQIPISLLSLRAGIVTLEIFQKKMMGMCTNHQG